VKTRLDAQFLKAVVLMTDFKAGEMRLVKAALLAFAVNGLDFTAADLPGEITQGDTHIAGAACGSLVTMGFLRVVDRVKSPDASAKGRKLYVFRLSMGKLETVRTWFREQGLHPPDAGNGGQMNLLAA
jgi:hypothetical protein